MYLLYELKCERIWCDKLAPYVKFSSEFVKRERHGRDVNMCERHH